MLLLVVFGGGGGGGGLTFATLCVGNTGVPTLHLVYSRQLMSRDCVVHITLTVHVRCS